MITHLAISGGASSGIQFVGSLKYLEDTNQLCNVKYYLGTSVGAIIAVLLSYKNTNYVIENIKNIQSNLDINQIDLNRFILEYGFLSKKSIITSVEDILKKTFKTVPTLLDLYNFSKKEVIISSLNLNTEKIVYFNHKTHPNMIVSHAISLSMNIPIIFEKEIFENELYIDAGLINNLSWEYFNDIHTKNKFGIYLYVDVDNTQITSCDLKISQYFINILKIVLKQSGKLYEQTIDIKNENIFILKDSTLFSDKLTLPTNEKINEMLLYGYNEIQSYLKKKL